jgi:hypothetical protein
MSVIVSQVDFPYRPPPYEEIFNPATFGAAEFRSDAPFQQRRQGGDTGFGSKRPYDNPIDPVIQAVNHLPIPPLPGLSEIVASFKTGLRAIYPQIRDAAQAQGVVIVDDFTGMEYYTSRPQALLNASTHDFAPADPNGALVV